MIHGGGAVGGKVERILLARREWNENKPGVKSKLFAVVCVHTLSARARSLARARAQTRGLETTENWGSVFLPASREENAEVAFARLKKLDRRLETWTASQAGPCALLSRLKSSIVETRHRYW